MFQINSFGESTSLAFCMVKLSNIRTGVRSLALTNEIGVKYPLAVLLVDISVLSSEQLLAKETCCKKGLEVSRSKIIFFFLYIVLLQQVISQLKVPGLTLTKRAQLKTEEANLTLDMLDLMQMKNEWESLSSNNCNALNVPSSVDNNRPRSLEVPVTKNKVKQTRSNKI